MNATMLAALLWAIAMVETGHDPDAIGRAGERGAHQLMPYLADRTPEQHLRWLEHNLPRHGVPAEPYHLAAAWNAGLTRYTTGRAPARTYDYAQRVVNLYEEQLRRSKS